MSDDNVKEEVAEAPAAEEAPTPNAVLVQRSFEDGGKVKVSVMVLGDVKLTEVRDILGLGIKEVTRELGL